jgi:hypothetical protein
VIVGSLLLIVIAVGLLVVGLLQGANALLVASIAASLLAAIALIVGGRQVTAARTGSRSEGRTGARRASRLDSRLDSRVDAHLDDDLAGVETADELRRSRRAERQTVGAGIGAGGAGSVADETSLMAPVRDVDPYTPAIPQQQHDDDRYQGASSSYSSHADDDDDDYEDDEDPEDEPPAQQTSAADAARIAAMSAEVFVIDGRPRYHLRGCVHMLGRDSEPLPVGEAIELGFSPCSVCEPDSSLLAAARRV